jgi:hypothetical protein
MKTIKNLLHKNKSAIIFFGLIFFGIFSFISNQNQQVRQISSLDNLVNGSFSLIENQYSNLVTATLISSDNPEDYEKIISSADDLINKIKQIQSTIPAKTNNQPVFDNTINSLDIYLQDTLASMQTIKERYKKDLEFLPNKNQYFKYKESIPSGEIILGLEILEKATVTEDWYYSPEQKNDENYHAQTQDLLSKIQDLKANPDQITEENINSLYEKTSYFAITKKFRISGQTDLKDKEYYEKLDSLVQDLNSLKDKYSIE